MQNVPKGLLVVAVMILLLVMSGASIEAALIIITLTLTFIVQYLWSRQDNHNEALRWFVNHVQRVDEPINGSDAPESLKKLVGRGGDNGNT